MTRLERVTGSLISVLFIVSTVLVDSYLIQKLTELPGWFSSLVFLLGLPMLVSAVKYLAKCLEGGRREELAGRPGL